MIKVNQIVEYYCIKGFEELAKLDDSSITS